MKVEGNYCLLQKPQLYAMENKVFQLHNFSKEQSDNLSIFVTFKEKERSQCHFPMP